MEELKSLLNIQQKDVEARDWLGGGCASTVFKGLWHNNGDTIEVAIKKMKIHSEEILSGICKEFKLMQSLPFENICKLYGGCIVDNGREVWLIMEYADGGDLHNFIQRHKEPLPKDLQLSFFVQATKAIATLHNAPSPILHRDVKSLNFLVQKNSKLLLTDFGLSKAKALVSTETYTVGTVRWVAPEIVLTNKRYWSEKADIFSLGMVFYEIFTRECPYNEDSDLHVNHILDKIKHGILPKLPAECPKELAAIIRQCWNFKPDKRPNANELLAMWASVDLPESPITFPRINSSPPKRTSLLRIAIEKSHLTTSSAAISPHRQPPAVMTAPHPHPSPASDSTRSKRHQRSQSDTTSLPLLSSLLIRNHKEPEPEVPRSSSSIVHEVPQTAAANNEASKEINDLMNAIKELGVTLQTLSAQLEVMVRQDQGEQSESYKKLYAQYSEVQEKITTNKASLLKLTENLWSKGAFETPSATRHRSRSKSVNNVSQLEKPVLVTKRFTSFTTSLHRASGKFFGTKKDEVKVDDPIPAARNSNEKEVTKPPAPPINPELFKLLIQQKYAYKENIGAPFYNQLRTSSMRQLENETKEEADKREEDERSHNRTPRSTSESRSVEICYPPRPADSVE